MNRPNNSGGVFAGFCICAISVSVAGGVSWFCLNNLRPEVRSAPTVAAVEPRRRLAMPHNPNTVPDYSEWERKSRAKLAEGIALLKSGKNDEAKLAIGYGFGDCPNDTTAAQKEFMMEVAARLSVITFVEGDKEAGKKYLTSAEYRRKQLGWNVDRYDAWYDSILRDTGAIMGVK